MKYDLIVVGSGPGGYEAAVHAAKMGKQVLLFEKGALGGACLNVGCIPTKTLLKSSRFLSYCREAGLYGVSVGKASIDLSAVQARKRKIIASLAKGIEDLLRKSGVELVKAEARLRAAGRVEAAGKEYAASHILLATGSTTAVPPIKGIDALGVHDSSSILEIEAAPTTLAIIGGGIIGLEFACLFNELGTRVTVVEMLPRVATELDADITKRLVAALKKGGVAFKLSSPVSRVEKNKLVYENEKGVEEEVACKMILNAAGRVPCLDGLADAGLAIEDGAVKVSPGGETSIKGVWACGDVIGKMPLAHAAVREGIVAVNNIFGVKDSIDYHAVPWVVHTHPEMAGVGASEEELVKRGVSYKKSVSPMGLAGRFIIENEGKTGTVKVLRGEKDGRILGVHMIGGLCGEMIFGASMIIQMKMTVDDVRKVVFPHPTVSEALKEAITKT